MKLPASINKKKLEELYRKFNKREFIHPDPLEFVCKYRDPADREVVGLIASSLAFGNVKQIIKSVNSVLEKLDPAPAQFLKQIQDRRLLTLYPQFKHRWTTGDDVSSFLIGIKKILMRFGSIQECFAAGIKSNSPTTLPALAPFVNELLTSSGIQKSSLMPLPEKGSACKRLNLFLKWMVRHDEVDPGGWDCIAPAQLIIPLDTHMHCIGCSLNLTQRKQGDMKTALEITEAFRKFSPEDPTKYDFALTRLGIRDEYSVEEFLNRCGMPMIRPNASKKLQKEKRGINPAKSKILL